VLRALLAMGLGQLRATRIAVLVGVVMAALLGIGGTLWLGNPWLMVVAVFVFVAGQAELQAAYYREQQRRAEAVAEPLVRPLGDGGSVRSISGVPPWAARAASNASSAWPTRWPSTPGAPCPTSSMARPTTRA